MPRVVHAACPHDCPDTCAMHVTVDEDGRAMAVGGDPEHPITAGFLCGKVSNYLDRVYAEDRILQPADPRRGEGRGRASGGPPGTRRSTAWPPALLRAAIDEHGGEAVLPYSYVGTQGLLQGDIDERAAS